MENRRLIVMRHAKSSWGSEAVSDHKRPLNGRGQRDAPRVAGRLVELGWQPQLIVSSNATRTKETCRCMRDAWSQDVPVEYSRQLYHGAPGDLFGVVAGFPAQIETALAVGHNPGWQEAVMQMCGQYVVMKTATAALLERAADDWPSAVDGTSNWTLLDVINPRDLAEDSS